MIKFNIESFSAQHVSGWAYDPDSQAGHVLVNFALQDGKQSIHASLFRKHLLDAGIGDGHAGFSFHLGRGQHFNPIEPIIFESKNDRQIFEIPPTIQRALYFDYTVDRFLASQEYLFDCVLALIVKNEAHYTEEWIEYHRSIGIDHFLIFDNESNDRLRELLYSYIKMGIVTYIKWPQLAGATLSQQRSGWLEQDTAYACAIRLINGKAKWIGFLDVDEFVVFDGGIRLNIREFLDSFQEPIVTLFWRLFGTSGIVSPTDQLVLERFTRRANDTTDRLSKVFVRPEFVHRIINTHRFVMSGDHMNGFTTSNIRVYGDERLPASYSGATIHHYHTRSREEFMSKVRRGWPKNDDNKNINWEHHFKLHDTNDLVDTSAENLVKDVKLRIEKSRANQNFFPEEFAPISDWLLKFNPSYLYHVEVAYENKRYSLEGFIVDLLSPNDTEHLLVHDGYGKILAMVNCNQHSDILAMNRIAHGSHGFRVELNPDCECETVFITCKKFTRQVRLSTFSFHIAEV